MKDGVDIPDANDDTYIITSATVLDAGKYICRITNILADQLTLFSRPITVLVLPTDIPDDESAKIPTAFALYQNHPNPFNPTTTIRYDLPKTSTVVLKIYNTLGQEVQTLINEKHSAGKKEVVWDGRDRFGQQVGSGIYIYNFRAGDYVKSRKMILMK